MEAQIEKAIKLRKQANFKILTRLAQIIECSPHLRFQQILSNYKVCELGKDKFYAAENCPIYKEGSGRDLILYYQDPTIEVEKVDNMFMSLQDTYRSYEKELNALKAELKEEVNKLSNTQEQEYREKMAEFKAKYDKYTSELGELRSRFNSWKTSEMERISKLKIALPKNLLDIFEEIRRQGDSSSK